MTGHESNKVLGKTAGTFPSLTRLRFGTLSRRCPVLRFSEQVHVLLQSASSRCTGKFHERMLWASPARFLSGLGRRLVRLSGPAAHHGGRRTAPAQGARRGAAVRASAWTKRWGAACVESGAGYFLRSTTSSPNRSS